MEVSEQTTAVMRLAGKLLDQASDYFAEHSCNDFDLLEALDFDEVAAREIATLYHCTKLNKMPDTLVIGDKCGDVWEQDFLNIPDYGLMWYMGGLLQFIADCKERS